MLSLSLDCCDECGYPIDGPKTQNAKGKDVHVSCPEPALRIRSLTNDGPINLPSKK